MSKKYTDNDTLPLAIAFPFEGVNGLLFFVALHITVHTVQCCLQ